MKKYKTFTNENIKSEESLDSLTKQLYNVGEKIIDKIEEKIDNLFLEYFIKEINCTWFYDNLDYDKIYLGSFTIETIEKTVQGQIRLDLVFYDGDKLIDERYVYIKDRYEYHDISEIEHFLKIYPEEMIAYASDKENEKTIDLKFLLKKFKDLDYDRSLGGVDESLMDIMKKNGSIESYDVQKILLENGAFDFVDLKRKYNFEFNKKIEEEYPDITFGSDLGTI